MDFLGTGLGRHGVASDLFEIVYGSLGFVKLFCEFFKDRFGSSRVVMGLLRIVIQDPYGSFSFRYGIVQDRYGSLCCCFRIV